ncbi:MAG: DcaP family trimeric outer membrane transporter [Pseudomonadota bacterium]|nr:DcaP family trimeric outer membrane transporter [Pseudomonadota bacterium]
MKFRPHAKSASLLLTCLASGSLALPAAAGFDFDLPNGDKISFGGYAKADFRHVDGDIPYQDYWVGNFPGGTAQDTSHTGFSIKESRVNVKYTHGDISAFVEWDFYGGGGNEVVSNSSNDRLRHFFIKFDNWLIGQTWSNFMPLAALPEALDFGGPHVGEVFNRQVQVRYTEGNFSVSVENPETNGDGDVGSPASAVGVTGSQADSDESIPDVTARYTFKGDWGQVTVAGLVRQLNQGGIDETAVAANVSGRIKTFGEDDLRFQATFGEPGRYAAAGMTPDIVTDPDDAQVKVEETVAYTVAYRHFWNSNWRSTAYYGAAETDVLERERSHWAVNLIGEIRPRLTAGIEIGQYKIEDEGIDAIDSNYLQFSTKYAF